jgi:hypothetical protein
MQNVDDEIRTITEAFAQDLGVLVRKAALEAAAASLGTSVLGAAPAPAAAKRGRGRPRAAATALVAAPRAKTARGRAAARGSRATPMARGAGLRRAAPARAPGEKRPPGELAKLTDKLGDYIESHPGQRMESIGKALGVPTRELNLPVKKLLAAKRIRTEGHKRATEYFPT